MSNGIATYESSLPYLPERYLPTLLPSEITLSTMTLDGFLTNIKFDKVTAIDNLEVQGDVLEIGSNFGYKVADNYHEMICYKNRRTKKPKKVTPGAESSRRVQGFGTHFNSQVTFTIRTDLDLNNTYQIKLFTNGRMQIPGIGKLSKGNEDILDDIISTMISYAQRYPDVLIRDPKRQIEILYLTPILQNFKAPTLLAKDCMLDVRIGIDENGSHYLVAPFINLTVFENIIMRTNELNYYYESKDPINDPKANAIMMSMDQNEINDGKPIRAPFPIDNVIFNPERYAGLLIKFSTPKIIEKSNYHNKFIEIIQLYYHKRVPRSKPVKPIVSDDDTPLIKLCKFVITKFCEITPVSRKHRKKLTTVKMFRSGKINLDHVNNLEQATMIRDYLVKLLRNYWFQVIYYLDNEPNITIYRSSIEQAALSED